MLLTHLESQFQSLDEKDPLSSFRRASWKQLSQKGLPTKKDEAYRYVSLKELYEAPFSLSEKKKIDKAAFVEHILPECKHSHIVFVDGQFSQELSDLSLLPREALLLPLSNAFSTHASFLSNAFSRTLQEEQDPFVWINLALHREGLFFYLPPKLKVETPVQLLFVSSAPVVSFPRLHLVLGKESEMRWVISDCSLDPHSSYLSIPAVELFLEEGASLHLVRNSTSSATAWQLGSLQATLKKRARLQSLHVHRGAKILRQNYRIQLKGEESEALLSGLAMLSGRSTAHVHALIDHEAPHTRSMQRFKGILKDTSQSSFEGKILVRPEAQKTDAYQLSNHLLLNEGTIVNAKPNLEVFADDVKASHGATIAELDEESLFYLRARGISQEEAKRLLTAGFCQEILEQIPYPSLRV